MPLGRQFEDTFFGESEYHRGKEYSGKPLQGMLFSPHTATGSKDDPLVPEEERRAQARTSYNTEGMSRWTRGSKKLESQQKMLEEGVFQSGIPQHLLKDVKTRTRIVPSEGRAHYSPSSNMIKLNENVHGPKYQEVPAKTAPVYKSGNPIPNPNFSRDTRHIETEASPRSEFSAHGTFFNEKGKRIPSSKIHDGDYALNNEQRKNLIDPLYLPEGHSANIFPGKGKDTNKYVTHSFKVEVGYRSDNSWKNDGYKIQWFHTRHEAIPTGETKEIPATRKRVSGGRSLSMSTLVHETGHHLDPNVGSNVRDKDSPDTVTEAVADGFTDRFHHSRNEFEDSLSPSKERAQTISNPFRGYGTGHHSVGRNNVNKALYAAVRQHVSMGDRNYLDIPSRDTFVKDCHWLEDDKEHNEHLEHANKMLLGHMYDKHPHVQEILGHLKLGKVGENAANYYRSRSTDAGRGAPKYEQEKLF